jgi:Tol biopolymer transport system component
MRTSLKYLACITSALCILSPASIGAPKRRTKPKRTSKTTPAKATTKITPAFLRGKIAFIEKGNLWVMDGAGGSRALVLAKPFGDSGWGDVAFSPDHKFIAYSYAPAGKDGERIVTGSELFVVPVGGGERRKLTDTKFSNYAHSPRWSLDGTRILYTRASGYRMGGPGFSGSEIRVVNADGSGDKNVRGNVADVGQSHRSAFWSRDGQRILFTHYTGNTDYNGDDGGRPELQVGEIEGQEALPFDNNYAPWDVPEVSPDGSLRAVAGEPNIPNILDLLQSAPPGVSQKVLLLSADIQPSNPRWSANGKAVVFQAQQHYMRVAPDGAAQSYDSSSIWRVNADGNGLRRLIENATLVDWLK